MAYYRPQRSCGKVIFSQASIILSTGGGDPEQTPPWEDTPGLGKHPPPGRHPPGQTPPPIPAVATAVDGTHPTGMHSC